MKISMSPPTNGRPLLIDFNQYTDGDPEFKKELIVLMIDNIKELQSSLKLVEQQSDLSIFSKTCHKIKPTISMLADVEFDNIIHEIGHDANAEHRQEKMKLLNTLCGEIIKSLENENR